MKPLYIKFLLLSIILIPAFKAKAQQNDDLLNLLIQKKVVTQEEADSLRADLAIKAQAQKEKQTKYPLSLGRALNLSGLIQTRYQAFQAPTGLDGFDIRRARLDLKGAITNRWDYELYVEFAAAPKLLDGYTSYKFGDYLKVSAGQFKIPFSLESLISDSQLELVDRSQVVEALASRSKDVIGGNQNGRDIGAQVSGSFVKLNDFYLFDYSFGIFNGAGASVTGDNNKNKDLAGRFTIHPVRDLSISYNFYEGHAIVGTATKTQPRNRRGVDARYVYGPLSLTAEYDRGTDGTINRDGWFGQAAYFILPKQLQVAAKVDTYDPDKTIRTDRSTWYTAGANYYFNSWVRLSLDYSYRREELANKQVKNNLLVTQLQLQF